MKQLLSLLLVNLILVFHGNGQGRINDFALSKGDLIEGVLFHYYDEEGFNGSVLVVEKGEIIYENTFGFASFADEDPLDRTTPFYIASLSKQFTAAAILKLQEEGKLSVSDPIRKYLPYLPKTYDPVILEQLLTHTAGVPDYFTLGVTLPGISNNEVYSALLKKKVLDFTPGTKYRYSNSGYVLLAMVIQIASGLSIDEYFKLAVFGPLAMNNTYVVTDNTPLRDIAYGYTQKLKEDDYNLRTVGDGGIFSTAEDLNVWLKALNNGEFISEESLAKMYSPLILANGRSRNYGYGWELGSNLQGNLVYHTGGLAGYRTYLEYQQDAHNAIIILTNNSFSKIVELRNTLVKLLDGRINSVDPSTK